MKRGYYFVLALIILTPLCSYSIEPTWDIDLGSVFDNREGDGKINKAETYFFVTLAPEIGLRFTPKDRIAGGVNWNQPLENKFGKIQPTVYYRHEGEKWKFSMGMFPRTQLREPLPGFLWSDSLTYFQKNVRGALVQYESRHGFFDAYIDWRALQSETKREAFNIMFHGELRPRARHLLIGAHVLMNHFAKSKKAGSSQSVVDNFLINPYLGLDYSRSTALDSLVVKAGILQTVERHRLNSSGWDCPGGLWIDGIFEWRMLGARNSLYMGRRGILPLYGEFGSLLYQGEGYYQSKFYDRLDLYGHIYRNKYIDLEAQLNFNFTQGGFMFYQRMILNINIGNL